MWDVRAMRRFFNMLKEFPGRRARPVLPYFLATAFLTASCPIRVFAEVAPQDTSDTSTTGIGEAPAPEPATDEGGQSSVEPSLDDSETPILSDEEVEAIIDAITRFLDNLSESDVLAQCPVSSTAGEEEAL